MKMALTLTALVFYSNSLWGSCLEDFRKFNWKTLASPITSTAISSGSSTVGSSLSFAGSSAGVISSQTEATTAGALYSVAFAFEGQYYLEGAWWDLRNYRSRATVYKIIKQAQVGIGPELQELLVDINQRTITGAYYELEELVEIINTGNRERVYCQERTGIFTLKNLGNYILDQIGEGPDSQNSDDDQDDDLDQQLNDYWDDFDDLF